MDTDHKAPEAWTEEEVGRVAEAWHAEQQATTGRPGPSRSRRRRSELSEATSGTRRGSRFNPRRWEAVVRAWLREHPGETEQTLSARLAATGTLPDDLERAYAALTAEALAPTQPRPTAFTPAAITVLSDPHTQAGVRSIWAPGEWTRPTDGQAYYKDANGVMVYARAGGATDIVLGLDDNKVSALLICLGKWFAETNGNPAWPEAARLHVDDVLAFRGIKKHPRGGYQPKQKEQAKEDVLFLRDLWVRSNQQVWETTKRGKRQLVDVVVNDPLLEVSIEDTIDLWGAHTPYAFRVRPGPWATHYLGGPQHWTTAVLRQIMAYHPYSDRLKMRLGIYLTFQWRIRAHKGTWGQPWKLKTLLEGAKIEVPARNPQRFFPQVLEALAELREDGVLTVCEALDVPAFPDWCPPADEPPKRWVPRLLGSRWRLLPAEEVRGRLPKPEEGHGAR